MNDFYNSVLNVLKQDDRFFSENGELLRNAVYEAAMKMDSNLIKLLYSDEITKEKFFTDIDGIAVFDKVGFGWVINNRDFLPDSYTRFKNKIGLVNSREDYISTSDDVELVFPYKDCILEGGQTTEEQKRNEIFYNETLAPDEVDRILSKKVLSNAMRYTDEKSEKTTMFDDNDNLIIKGNNLIGLSVIEEKYAKKIKCIFIDPPYYFIANKPSDTFSYNSNFKLSSWLVFMKNRLEIAHRLLADDGILYMAISDEGAHYLKVMTDSIFTMDNFIADVTWESRKSISSDGLMSENNNHILVYAKNKTKIDKNKFRLALDVESFIYDDEDGKGKYRLEPFDAPAIRKNLEYVITNPNTGEEYTPPKGRHWRTEEATYLKLLNAGKIRFGANGTAKPQLKAYYSEVKEAGKGKASSTIWHDVKQSIIWQEIDTNTNATKDQIEMFGETVFTNPKPEDLIKRAIELSTNDGDIVLDFFMGSATTQAVAMKMQRKFIGLEQMDYLHTVSIPRLVKVMQGEQTGISTDVNWKGGGSFVYCELAKLNQKYVDEIENADNDEKLISLLEEIIKTGFISYKVNPSDIDTSADDFKALSLDDKKRLLMELIDKNQLYVNYCDIDDETFEVSEEDKAFTKSFYGEV